MVFAGTATAVVLAIREAGRVVGKMAPTGQMVVYSTSVLVITTCEAREEGQLMSGSAQAQMVVRAVV